MNQSKILGIAVAVLAVTLSAWVFGKLWPKGEPADSASNGMTEDETGQVRLLSSNSLAAAGIKTVPVVRSTLPLSRTLPARFAYDDTHHVEIRAATDGVLESVLVKPGDHVDAGQTIAVLRSPALGAARSKVLSRTADYELAKSEQKWQTAICQGVEQLAESIKAGNSVDRIAQGVGAETLGEYRSRLLTKYSQSILASQLASSVDGGSSSGAISGRVLQQRRSQLEQAQAELSAAIEQSLFETRQNCRRAEAAAAAARRELLVARQELATLQGAMPEDHATLENAPNDQNLAKLRIDSPLAGTVERKGYSALERVAAGEQMFVIADTTRLWVVADIRQRDWDAFTVRAGDVVSVTTAVTGRVAHEARVHHLGRQVDPNSGAVSLVAQIENPDGKFRPGLFARMTVPIGTIHDALLIPDSALIDLGGQASVFVSRGDAFEPVAVEVGARTRDQVQVLNGLTEGLMVASEGAFVLKSELLLEGEG